VCGVVLRACLFHKEYHIEGSRLQRFAWFRRGIWCSVSNGHDIFRRCREPDSEVYIEIRADRISVGFEGDLELCGIGIGWPTENGHAFTVGCPKHEFSLQMELQLDTRGLLHVKEADRQEFGPPPPGALPR
jgi:hypothetical protein